MPEVAQAGPPETPAKGLLARIIGIISSPKETYEEIVARPRILGALLLSVSIVVAGYTAFSSTQVGKELTLDQTFAIFDAMGGRVPDEVYRQTEESIMNGTPVRGAISIAVVAPIMLAVFAGLIFAVYTPLLGGDGTFSQVFAVVVYSSFITALQTLFMYPMQYMKRDMANPTSLLVFTPFLEAASFTGRLIGTVDFFRLWWVANLAIGVGVLYKRRTAPILWTMLAVYAVIALCYAAVVTAVSGA